MTVSTTCHSEKWILISGGDGYSTHVVEGREAMEMKFCWLLMGDDPPMTADAVSEAQNYVEHLRDEDNWICNWELGPVELTYRVEDGHIHVYRLNPDPASTSQRDSKHE